MNAKRLVCVLLLGLCLVSVAQARIGEAGSQTIVYSHTDSSEDNAFEFTKFRTTVFVTFEKELLSGVRVLSPNGDELSCRIWLQDRRCKSLPGLSEFEKHSIEDALSPIYTGSDKLTATEFLKFFDASFNDRDGAAPECTLNEPSRFRLIGNFHESDFGVLVSDFGVLVSDFGVLVSDLKNGSEEIVTCKKGVAITWE